MENLVENNKPGVIENKLANINKLVVAVWDKISKDNVIEINNPEEFEEKAYDKGGFIDTSPVAELFNPIPYLIESDPKFMVNIKEYYVNKPKIINKIKTCFGVLPLKYPRLTAFLISTDLQNKGKKIKLLGNKAYDIEKYINDNNAPDYFRGLKIMFRISKTQFSNDNYGNDLKEYLIELKDDIINQTVTCGNEHVQSELTNLLPSTFVITPAIASIIMNAIQNWILGGSLKLKDLKTNLISKENIAQTIIGLIIGAAIGAGPIAGHFIGTAVGYWTKIIKILSEEIKKTSKNEKKANYFFSF